MKPRPLPALALALLLSVAPGCATCALWNHVHRGHIGGVAVTVNGVFYWGPAVFFPCALVWDVVTFPFQIAFGYPPYGRGGSD